MNEWDCFLVGVLTAVGVTVVSLALVCISAEIILGMKKDPYDEDQGE